MIGHKNEYGILLDPGGGGTHYIYAVPRVCQRQGCDIDQECAKERVLFGRKCKRKGVF